MLQAPTECFHAQGGDLVANFNGALQRMFQERKRVETLQKMLDPRDPLLKQVGWFIVVLSSFLFFLACCLCGVSVSRHQRVM